MPNVTFKFVITETPLPADQDGRQQIIASISDDNARRIMNVTGLDAEVLKIKEHCERMLALAAGRFLGRCDPNHAAAAVMAECQAMGIEIDSPPTPPRGGTGVSGGPTELDRTKARMHDDAQAMLDTLGIPKRSEIGGEFTLQHRIGLLNDDAEREKGAAYRDAAAAEAEAADCKTKLAEAEKCRADQVIALDAYAEQRDSARQDADTLRCEVMEERNRREKSNSIANEAAKQRDRVKELAAEALIALKREWPQHALWRAQSPEAEPIRRLATAVGVELAETEIQRHGDVAAKLAQSSVLMPVLAEISRALTKFPTWPTDPLHAMAVLGEEYGELNKAILQEVYEPHKQDRAAVRTEAVQCAAMALRFLTSIDAYRFDRCEQHRQDVKDA